MERRIDHVVASRAPSARTLQRHFARLDLSTELFSANDGVVMEEHDPARQSVADRFSIRVH